MPGNSSPAARAGSSRDPRHSGAARRKEIRSPTSQDQDITSAKPGASSNSQPVSLAGLKLSATPAEPVAAAARKQRRIPRPPVPRRWLSPRACQQFKRSRTRLPPRIHLHPPPSLARRLRSRSPCVMRPRRRLFKARLWEPNRELSRTNPRKMRPPATDPHAQTREPIWFCRSSKP